MLSHTQEIDQIFHMDPNGPRVFLTIYVESDEWNHAQSMEWLQKKLDFYQSEITSGRAFETGTHKRYPYNPIEVISRDPVPMEAQEFLYQRSEELEKFDIVLTYEYNPDLWNKTK